MEHYVTHSKYREWNDKYKLPDTPAEGDVLLDRALDPHTYYTVALDEKGETLKYATHVFEGGDWKKIGKGKKLKTLIALKLPTSETKSNAYWSVSQALERAVWLTPIGQVLDQRRLREMIGKVMSTLGLGSSYSDTDTSYNIDVDGLRDIRKAALKVLDFKPDEIGWNATPDTDQIAKWSEDDEPFPLFCEAVLYELMNKEDARTLLARMSALLEALGMTDRDLEEQ